MKKGLKISLIIVGAILLVYLVLAIFPRSNNYKFDNPMRTDSDLPILIAHGGGNKEFPDNTLEAFYNAYSVDQRVMMDVTGKICDWNYSDLISQEVDFGYTNPTENQQLTGDRKHFVGPDGKEKFPTDVPYPAGVSPRHEKVFLATTLEELITSFPNNRINVEIKQSGELGLKALKEVLRLLEKHDAFDRVVLASFHEELYKEYQRLQKEGEVPAEFMFSPATGSATKFFILQLLKLDLFYSDKVCVFQLPTEQLGFNLATKGLVKAAHRNNLAVHYWTINDVEEMKHLIDIGADGIMTDYPHRLQEVYNQYKK